HGHLSSGPVAAVDDQGLVRGHNADRGRNLESGWSSEPIADRELCDRKESPAWRHSPKAGQKGPRVPRGMIPSGPYSLASCPTVHKLVRSFGTITEPLLNSSTTASPRPGY